MKQRIAFVVILMVLTGMLVWNGTSSADPTSKLMKILVKKGIITKEEAKELEQEIQRENKEQNTSIQPGTKGISSQVQKTTEWTSKMEVGYKDGAYIKTVDNRFSIRFNFEIEPLFMYDESETGQDSTSFSLRCTRFWVSGNVYHPWLKYLAQLTLESGSVYIRDAYVQLARFDWLQPQIGEFKVPYDREFLMIDFALEFIERSIAGAEFSLQRDMGAQFSGQVLSNHLTYALGIFNGSGINQNNVDTDYMYVGRLVWFPFDKLGYMQGAVDNPRNPRLAIGIAAAYLPGLEPGERKTLAGRLGDTNVVPVESNVAQAEADIAFSYRRVYLEGAYYFRNIDPKQETTYGSQQAYGLYFQTGYFMIPEHFEMVARYAYTDPDNPVQVANNQQQEGTFGLNYYFYGHPLHLQADYTLLSSEDKAGHRKDNVFRSAMVLYF